ncbi:MAG: hypothetical protein ACN2B6_00260 [Rickettsiales bacterium]
MNNTQKAASAIALIVIDDLICCDDLCPDDAEAIVILKNEIAAEGLWQWPAEKSALAIEVLGEISNQCCAAAESSSRISAIALQLLVTSIAESFDGPLMAGAHTALYALDLARKRWPAVSFDQTESSIREIMSEYGHPIK